MILVSYSSAREKYGCITAFIVNMSSTLDVNTGGGASLTLKEGE